MLGTLVAARRSSMKGDRRRAMVWSYFFLVIFVIFFLTPPLYMLITSLKSNAEISAAVSPWWIFNPTLANYTELLTSGGPVDQTHVFATWAFKVGIEGSDLPLGAAVSLFMFPILGVAAILILRNVRKRGNEA